MLMKTSVFVQGLSFTPFVATAQVIPTPVPESEIFTREEIGHALAPPTPNVGKATPSAANAPPDDGQWSMLSKNYAATRYSSLTEITPKNVRKLEPIVTFSLAVNKGQEAAPIVVDNTMYIVTAYPNYVYALDLTKPGAPLKWRFSPQPVPASQGVACCDVVNRGGTVSDGKYNFATLDGQVIAIDVTRICAWIGRMSRSVTSRAPLTSVQMCICDGARVATVAN
jgi:glucose dehydrogenase